MSQDNKLHCHGAAVGILCGVQVLADSLSLLTVLKDFPGFKNVALFSNIELGYLVMEGKGGVSAAGAGDPGGGSLSLATCGSDSAELWVLGCVHEKGVGPDWEGAAF